MNFFFKGYFWSLVLIFAGILLLINNLFHLRIPVASIVIALLFILLGIQLMIGPKGVTSSHEVIFDDAKLEANETDNKYDVIFGKSIIDLTQVASRSNQSMIKTDIVFGQVTIKIKKNDPIRIKASCVFGNISLPDGNTVSFGDRTYETDSYQDSDKKIDIKTDVVFGEATIVLVE
jgi:predicted membrane protein